MNPIEQFKLERALDIKKMSEDDELKELSIEWMIKADKYKYTYNFSWLGRPIIKFPNDIVIMQEIIWDVKPDLIIETGIAHGGSIIFSASMLELIGKDGLVVAVDIDIREHNKKEIENHPLSKRIKMFEGDSVSEEIVSKVREIARSRKQVMVCLDSLHTHKHVLKEMELYSPLVTVGSYMILPDTFIEYFPKGYYKDRPWDVGNNTMTAIREFLSKNDNFIIDKEKSDKLMITEAFDGYLKRVK
ncbi:MAG TPA: cephalosporin hydroxylase family protein [Syntrophorhabdaceae bacterium]|nr:cephalosporin hydroxylase family protein [Syntrophorhabdaceae bacterium]HOL05708.1 cephalosporin hydroxylase family protein [Syntrophorhabdaceae bacterium]HQE79394.1 cephalosporin hydroxylase family protein [Syntrophorhabdaceae bacterium]